MSQSNAHRDLVLATVRVIGERHPSMSVRADLQESPGDPVPPIIGGHRPDIIGRCVGRCRDVLIAEAKTDSDVDRQHTLDQIGAFVAHLGRLRGGVGTFILSVDGRVADRARTILRFTCRRRVSSQLRVNLFDGLDLWALGPMGAPQWHLC